MAYCLENTMKDVGITKPDSTSVITVSVTTTPDQQGFQSAIIVTEQATYQYTYTDGRFVLC
ncbi:hypothetical protein [Ochrobactrum sp. CGA5]|uniref:hypothetical protein n=1 Tax=Ochrobactrum sp. CGA5 TaxID=2583453 RepID=UPI00112311FE|nr:hypothetical protein [Ochrobactrum sp. CGA5]